MLSTKLRFGLLSLLPYELLDVQHTQRVSHFARGNSHCEVPQEAVAGLPKAAQTFSLIRAGEPKLGTVVHRQDHRRLGAAFQCGLHVGSENSIGGGLGVSNESVEGLRLGIRHHSLRKACIRPILKPFCDSYQSLVQALVTQLRTNELLCSSASLPDHICHNEC